MKVESQKRRGRSRLSGFPNLSTAVMLPTRNLNDPNGFYRLLEVEPWCSDHEIRKGYYKQSRRYHPDGSIPDEEKFLEVSFAYSILSKRRSEYDNLEEGVRWRLPGEEKVSESEPRKTVVDTSFAGYDYYYTQGRNDKLAQKWYEELIPLFRELGYSKRLALKLGDKLDVGRVVEVPYEEPTEVTKFILSIQVLRVDYFNKLL